MPQVQTVAVYPRRDLERQQVWPEKLGWRDLCFLFVYAASMLGVPALPLILGYALLTGNNEESAAMAAIGAPAQAAVYLAAGTALFALCWPEFTRSARTFRLRAPLKWGMIPVWEIVNFVLLAAAAALLTLITGQETAPSENQAGLEEIAQNANIFIFLIPTVLLAPLVEEYVFRHILIGKLSRWIPVWVTLPLSAVAFAALHGAAGSGESILSLLPYLVMGFVFGGVYLWSGRSFLYTAGVHALHNALATFALFTVSGLAQ